MDETMIRIGMRVLLALTLASGCAPVNEGSEPMASEEAALTGSPPATDPRDEAVAHALRGSEWDPDAPGPALRGKSAEASLMRLARGRAKDPRAIRVRATMALRHHPTEGVFRFLVGTVEGSDDPERVAASLATLASAFGRSRGAEVRELAAARLDDEDPAVSAAAREAVARVRLARWTAR